MLEVDKWIYDDHNGHRGHRVPELDDTEIDWSKAEYWDTGVDPHGDHYHLIRYQFSDGFTRLAAIWNPDDIDDEDWAEYEAATNGEDYYRI